MTDDRVSTPDQATTPTEPPAGMHDEGEWVTLKAAADAVGRSVSALRKRYQAGDLEKRKDDDGKVLLDLAAVRRLYSDTTPTTTARSSPMADLQPMWERIDDLHREILDAERRAVTAELREQFAQERRQDAERRVEALEAEIAALRSVTNPEPTTGGTEAEPIEKAEDRAPPSWWRRLRSGR